jgi:hypothetical protein
MAKQPASNSETFIFVLILIFAAILRFADLGVPPLSEFEARSTLAAHQLANQDADSLGDQPAYVLLTGPIFSLFSSSEATARLAPALFGLALVALPYFWRDVLGGKVALVLSGMLALDPGMVATSRLASGQIITISAALIALTAWRYSRPIVAGTFASVALLASPSVFIGLIAAVLALFTLQMRPEFSSIRWKPFALTVIVVTVFGATWFLQTPDGVSGLGATLAAFFAKLTQTGIGIAEIGLALLGYALPAVVFGVISAVNAWRQNNSVGKVVSVFALFALLLVLVIPGRQVIDLLWVTAALWVLAAMFIAQFLSVPKEYASVAFGELALILILGIFFGISLTKIAAGFDFTWVALGTFGLAVIATYLIGIGWSSDGAKYGVVWALLFFSALFLLSASSRFLRVETTDANDLWDAGPAAGSSRAIGETLQDLSVLSSGQLSQLTFDVQIENPAIAWELRNYRSPTDVDKSTTDVIIAPIESAETSEFADYRGQSFAIRVQRAWSGFPPNLFAWLFYRQASTQTEEIILWARADLFPDAQSLGGFAPETNP